MLSYGLFMFVSWARRIYLEIFYIDNGDYLNFVGEMTFKSFYV